MNTHLVPDARWRINQKSTTFAENANPPVALPHLLSDTVKHGWSAAGRTPCQDQDLARAFEASRRAAEEMAQVDEVDADRYPTPHSYPLHPQTAIRNTTRWFQSLNFLYVSGQSRFWKKSEAISDFARLDMIPK